jgi:transcriptional regulator with XRE-family HTH domain
MPEDVYDRIQSWRKARDLSQTELEKRAQLGRGAIFRIENRQKEVTAEELQSIARILGLETAVLLGEVPQEDGELMTAVRELLQRCPKQQRRAIAQVFYALGKQMDVAQAV